jgi:hypothetical protein
MDAQGVQANGPEYKGGVVMAMGQIKVGKKTAGHAAALQSKGYEVAEKDGHLQINCTGFHTATVDLTTDEGKETVRNVVANHQLFTYKTRFVIPGYEGAYSGIFACARLGTLSCLIAKDAVAKKGPVSSEMNAVLEDLGF